MELWWRGAGQGEKGELLSEGNTASVLQGEKVLESSYTMWVR